MDGFGDRLRRLRKDQDITQAQLAKAIGVVPSAIGKYERMPDAAPSIDALLRISDYFQVSTDYLLRGSEHVHYSVENNISGQLSNSPFIQNNGNGSVVSSDRLSPESMELLRIYENLTGRERLKLLNFAVDLEEANK